MDIAIEQLEANAHKAGGLLKALANDTRLMIVCNLVEKDMSVGELLKSIPLSQSALSQHLGILRREKIVSTRRNAQSIIYSLSSPKARRLVETLYDLYCVPADP